MASSQYLAPNRYTDDEDMRSDSDMHSVASMPPVSDDGRQSDNMSMRSTSPAPSVMSMSSSMQRAAYSYEYGRGINNYSDIYRLPADEEELGRLDRQHIMFIQAMGKYSPLLPKIMGDTASGSKAAVDLGCGSGSWIIDVAHDFPDCIAVGVDLVPLQNPNIPPNCRSEVDDVNLGLQHFYGCFDVAHTRLIFTGITSYQSLVHEIASILRPNGLIDITESDFCVYGHNKQRIPVQTGIMKPPWFPLWMALAKKAAQNRNADVEAVAKLYQTVSSHPAFKNVVHRDFWLPVSPFYKGNSIEAVYWNRIGTAMREDIGEFIKSGRPLLLGDGLPLAFVEQIEANVYEELRENKQVHYIRMENVYALKKDIRLEEFTYPSEDHSAV